MRITTNANNFGREIDALKVRILERPTTVLKILIPNMVFQLTEHSVIGDPNNAAYPYSQKPEANFQPGWYISNWQVTFNSPATSTVPNAGPEQGAEFAVDSATQMMSKFVLKNTDTIYISNLVPYANLIENEGHSLRFLDGAVTPLFAVLPSLISSAQVLAKIK